MGEAIDRDGRVLRGRVAASARARRIALGLTQEMVAERGGLGPRLVQKIEAGTENLTLSTLARLAAALETDASVFLTPPSPVDRASSPSSPEECNLPR